MGGELLFATSQKRAFVVTELSALIQLVECLHNGRKPLRAGIHLGMSPYLRCADCGRNATAKPLQCSASDWLNDWLTWLCKLKGERTGNEKKQLRVLSKRDSLRVYKSNISFFFLRITNYRNKNKNIELSLKESSECLMISNFVEENLYSFWFSREIFSLQRVSRTVSKKRRMRKLLPGKTAACCCYLCWQATARCIRANNRLTDCRQLVE